MLKNSSRISRFETCTAPVKFNQVENFIQSSLIFSFVIYMYTAVSFKIIDCSKRLIAMDALQVKRQPKIKVHLICY